MPKETKKAIEVVNKDKEITSFDPASQVEYAQKAAKALMTIIEATKPLNMNGKRYLYFEHWQTVARFFNTTVGIESTTKDPNGYIAKAVVYNKEGLVIGGAEASCMKDEKNWIGKPDFQLRSMAQTRAMAKALRSIYGFVAVLAGVEATPAEEMGDVEASDVPRYDYKSKISAQPIEKHKPTPRQADFIKKLATEKKVTQEGLKLMAQGLNPSQLIDRLLKYQTPTDLPTENIGEMSPEEKEIVDGLQY